MSNNQFNPQTTIIFDDSIVEILHNPELTNKPYLVRLHGYTSENYETRMSETELKELSEFINDYLDNINVKTTNY
jgi:uncharacterized protein YecE (DUF72 family)